MTADTRTDTRTDTLDRASWWVLLTVGFGVSLVIMDATIVNVALPVVLEDLHLTASDAQWLNASYSLMFAALLMTVGRVGDLWGRRRMFALGMVVFLLASVVAGASQDAATLVGARFAQGVGAAMIVPSTLSILNATFVGRARTIAFAVWGSAIGGMAAVGPLVGGWLATDVSWRWAFWLNIPVGLLVLVGVQRAVPDSRDPNAERGRDIAGVVLSALGMGGLVFALIESQWFGWWRQDSGDLSPVPVALAGGLVLLVVFVALERGRRAAGRPTLVDLSLFAIPTFRAGVVAALVVAFGEFGLLFTLPLLMQGTLGYSALGTGAVLLVLAVGTFLVSGAMPQISQRMTQRAIVQTGLLLEAIAVGGIALTLGLDISTWLLSGWLFLYGVGVGMATAQLTALLLSDVPGEQSGLASGLQSTVRQLGSALGVALLGGLLVGQLASSARDRLGSLGLSTGMVDSLTAAVKESAGVAIAGLESNPATQHAGHAAAQAMIHASRVTTGAAAVALVVGLLATFALPRTAARSEADSGHGDGR